MTVHTHKTNSVYMTQGHALLATFPYFSTFWAVPFAFWDTFDL